VSPFAPLGREGATSIPTRGACLPQKLPVPGQAQNVSCDRRVCRGGDLSAAPGSTFDAVTAAGGVR
jgi:hypothetical protein